MLALPWMLALKPLLQIPVGESALWMQQLMLGISCLDLHRHQRVHRPALVPVRATAADRGDHFNRSVCRGW